MFRGEQRTECPHCGANLIGDPIPERLRANYSAPYHWRREIMIVDPDKDMVVAYECPDCGKRWPR